MKLSQKNFLHNSSFEIKGLIFSQKTSPAADMRYGLKPLWYNGCGVISVYNALILLNRPHDLREILAYYESHGKWFFGLWGTDPFRISSFLHLSGIKTALCSPKKAQSGIYIIFLLNKPFKSMHYMTLQVLENGTIHAYNGYKNTDTVDKYLSFSDMFLKTNTCPIAMINCNLP
ncbi:MAG: hypothetical protein IJ736_14975 [Firmicutes bacterium]|nr:hypothetical protein [Bacillota bacterium]